MKATFQNTVDILVNAYLDDTLERGTCKACAVTNILGSRIWARLFVTMNDNGQALPQTIAGEGEIVTWGGVIKDFGGRAQEAIDLINKSGYTITELARVENAFETASLEGDAMFNGLMAVVDVLADIHGINLTEKESAKALFVKA